MQRSSKIIFFWFVDVFSTDAKRERVFVWWIRPTETSARRVDWRNACRWAWTKMVNRPNHLKSKWILFCYSIYHSIKLKDPEIILSWRRSSWSEYFFFFFLNFQCWRELKLSVAILDFFMQKVTKYLLKPQ